MAKICLIFLNYNSSSDLKEAVASVEESTVPEGFERQVVIVENSAKESEWEAVRELKKYPDVELIKSPENMGFTGGNNLAIKAHPEADYYLLLNSDTKVSKEFLVELLKPGIVGLASPKIYFYPGYEFHKDRYQKKDLGKVIWYAGGEIDWQNVVGKHQRVDEVDGKKTKDSSFYDPLSNPSSRIQSPLSLKCVPTDFCTGCCLLISRAVVDKIGLLDDKLFFSWEDVDYSIRAKRAGFPVIYVPGSVIWHKNANTSGGAGSPTQDFYQTRNRLIFAFRYAPKKTAILLLWQLLKTANLNRLKAIFSALISGSDTV